MAGDNYNNSGYNFGHMGPVNYGKQELRELTDEHIRQAISMAPRGRPVAVWAVGTQSAFPMQRKMAAALRAAGFQVTEESAGMKFPLPEGPLSIDTSGAVTEVIIAPKA